MDSSFVAQRSKMTSKRARRLLGKGTANGGAVPSSIASAIPQNQEGRQVNNMLTVIAICAAIMATSIAMANTAVNDQRPIIQMAILLDTSGSMSGLLQQARTQLWSVVNEFATMKKDGKIPELRVALYEYGKSSIPAEEDYLRMIQPLTNDLDKISEELFALTTNGSKEYCGTVIKAATEGLAWIDSSEVLKTIFIAGNEPFTQGNVDYRDSCREAIAKGVTVNTIYCGPHETGISTNWKDGALLTDGSYTNIDHNQETVHIDAPQDKEIALLSAKLNTTYIPYGSLGKEGLSRQAAQDRNAIGAAVAATIQRSAAKATAQYVNYSWDLVDALSNNIVKLEDIKDKDLPETMQDMSLEERKVHVETNLKQRQDLQKRITELNTERKQYVAEEMKKLSDKGDESLETAMIKAVRLQATRLSFEIE